ncbi:MAG: polysaccharide deacetylase family protein [Bacteriovorax sp.]|jgi:peptidoglycan/xylan/chitin deacetylase (PgdA/CDA1 family)
MRFVIIGISYLMISLAFGAIEIDYDLMDFSPKNVGEIHQGHSEIILTFDDGPIPGVTNRVLDILADYNIKATFFVIGKNALAYPHLMRRMVEEGHTVGNHSMSHMALKNLDPLTWKETVQREVMEAHNIISPYMVNNRHYFFRAPYAAWAQHYAEFLNETETGREYKGPILWDLGGEIEYKNGKYLQAADWECWSKKISIKDCMSGYVNEAVRRRGGVVLMHDLRHQSAEMLEKLIPELQDRGFGFTTLNDVNWK